MQLRLRNQHYEHQHRVVGLAAGVSIPVLELQPGRPLDLSAETPKRMFSSSGSPLALIASSRRLISKMPICASAPSPAPFSNLAATDPNLICRF
jgi:hypothetical protein